jgi:hypothetical protein
MEPTNAGGRDRYPEKSHKLLIVVQLHYPQPAKGERNLRAVHKYRLLETTTLQTLEIPDGYRFCHGAEQNSVPTLWFEVDKDNGTPKKPLRIMLMGTGRDLPETDYAYEFLCTIMMKNGLVWHIYNIL